MTANTALSSSTTTTTISGGNNHHHSSSMTGTHHNNHHLVITGSSLLSSSSTTSSSSGRCGPSLIKYRLVLFPCHNFFFMHTYNLNSNIQVRFNDRTINKMNYFQCVNYLKLLATK